MTINEMTQIEGAARENVEGFVEYYDRYTDAEGRVHHELSHVVVTATGEVLRRRHDPPAEKMRRYLAWRAVQRIPAR